MRVATGRFPRLRPRPRGLGTVMVVSAVGAVVLAACGGGSSSASAGSTTTTSRANNAAFQAYRKCLADHGVNLPAGRGGGRRGLDPNGGTRPSTTLPPGVTQAQVDAARQACRDKLPAGGNGGNGGQFGAAYASYAACLGQHGYKVPDPNQDPNAFFNINRSDPAFVAANAPCKQLLPNRGPRGSSTTTATS